MATKSKIEWTELTWNPVTGCSKISLGCKNCYAERLAFRLKSMGQKNYINGFNLTLHENLLDTPFKLHNPKMIFVNSMSDLFHKNIPFEFINKIFIIMMQTNIHKYQILTKRSQRLLELNNKLIWPSNVWMGVSVENAAYTFRINHLRETNAKIKFISFEPLLGPIINLNLKNINWVIVGGESGPKARPMKKKWVEDIRDQCISEKIPFFFKQWGGVNKKKTGRTLSGRIWDQMPVLDINDKFRALSLF
ncbi:MAG: phage Gp37/Gp68 family protein [bacterium]|nr:phage Gp37/Gp68 family protein [bacterium]